MVASYVITRGPFRFGKIFPLYNSVKVITHSVKTIVKILVFIFSWARKGYKVCTVSEAGQQQSHRLISHAFTRMNNQHLIVILYLRPPSHSVFHFRCSVSYTSYSTRNTEKPSNLNNI